jgi:hypothetical protein
MRNNAEISTNGIDFIGVLPAIFHIIASIRGRWRENSLICDARAINDKVRLLAKLGAALIEAKEAGADLQEAVASAIGWDALARTVGEAKRFARPDKTDLSALAARALTREQTAALAEVTIEYFLDHRGEEARSVRRVKFKLHDKRAALVDLGRHLGIFVHKPHHDGQIEVATNARQFIIERLERLAVSPRVLAAKLAIDAER